MSNVRGLFASRTPSTSHLCLEQDEILQQLRAENAESDKFYTLLLNGIIILSALLFVLGSNTTDNVLMSLHTLPSQPPRISL